MRPPVAMTAHLADKPPLGRTENLSKDRVPGFPHQPEQPGDIQLGYGPVAERVLIEAAQTLGIQPFCCDGAVDFTLDKGTEPRPQEIESLADPVVVGSSHIAAVLFRSEFQDCFIRRHYSEQDAGGRTRTP